MVNSWKVKVVAYTFWDEPCPKKFRVARTLMVKGSEIFWLTFGASSSMR